MNPLDNTSISPLSLEAMQMSSWMNDRTTFELKPQYSHMSKKWSYRKVSHKSLRYYVVSIVDVGFHTYLISAPPIIPIEQDRTPFLLGRFFECCKCPFSITMGMFIVSVVKWIWPGRAKQLRTPDWIKSLRNRRLWRSGPEANKESRRSCKSYCSMQWKCYRPSLGDGGYGTTTAST